jgi:hypothetical protein
MGITLNRDQIKKLISIYEHFKEIKDFTISIDGDMLNVQFNLCNIETKSDKTFIKETFK